MKKFQITQTFIKIKIKTYFDYRICSSMDIKEGRGYRHMQNMNSFGYCIYVRTHNQQLFKFECVGSFVIDLIADYLHDKVYFQSMSSLSI